MKLTYPHYLAALKTVLPLYIVSGDELLLKQETFRTLKNFLQEQGFTEWIKIDSDHDFSPQRLLAPMLNFSLFTPQQGFVLDCHTFSEHIRESLEMYVRQAPSHCTLIVLCPKFEKRQLETKWYQSLEPTACHITIWPIESQALPAWIKSRAEQLKLYLDPEAITYLCERSDHHAGAALQELEKLSLSFQERSISFQDIQHTIAQSSRYQVYELMDAILLGDLLATRRILICLKNQKIEAFAILISLTYTLKQLLQLQELGTQMPLPQAFKQCGIWSKKIPCYQAALHRFSMDDIMQYILEACECERILKGLRPHQETEDYLERLIERCCLGLNTVKEKKYLI